MSNKTPNQILQGYQSRLDDRQKYLHEKIELSKDNKKPFGYELEEFFAIRWVLAFIASNPDLALAHVTQDLKARSEGKKEQ